MKCAGHEGPGHNKQGTSIARTRSRTRLLHRARRREESHVPERGCGTVDGNEGTGSTRSADAGVQTRWRRRAGARNGHGRGCACASGQRGRVAGTAARRSERASPAAVGQETSAHTGGCERARDRRGARRGAGGARRARNRRATMTCCAQRGRGACCARALRGGARVASRAARCCSERGTRSGPRRGSGPGAEGRPASRLRRRGRWGVTVVRVGDGVGAKQGREEGGCSGRAHS